MAIEVTDLTTLNVSKVQAIHETLAELVQEENSNIDAKQGVLYQLLFYYSAVLAAAKQEEIDRVRRSMSLKAIEEDPSLADDDIVDSVLSNWGIQRTEGLESTGTITIVVDRLAPVTIPAGGIFEAGSLIFVANSSFVARTAEANIQSVTDRVLVARADGTYSFTIGVTSQDVGAATRLKKGEALTPQFTIVNFVKAFATSDFSGGLDTETNSELIQRQKEGPAAKALSGRINMKSYLNSLPVLDGPTVSSIIGYGDPEMLRDKHSLFPISSGGRADWYVRTQKEPIRLTVTKTATLIEKTVDDRGIWQVTIDRDDAPGFLRVLSVVPKGLEDFAGTFEITEEERNVNLTDISGELTPDIKNAIEGVYSRFQTSIVRFEDSETNTSGLSVGASTQEYDVTLLYLPHLADLQSEVGSLNYRNYGGDVLIKAPIPCFVGVGFRLQGKSDAVIPNPELLKLDIADYVNSLGFVGRLHGSAISDVIHNSLPSNVAVSSMDIIGRILRPDGQTIVLRSSDVIVVPNDADNMISAKTVNFFLDPEDIAISVEVVDIPDV